MEETQDKTENLMDVLHSVEQLDVAAIEKEITDLESRVERLRRLLAVRRGRKRPAPESVA